MCMTGRSDTEMSVSQWYCGEGEIHASNSWLKTAPEVQCPLFSYPHGPYQILVLPIHILVSKPPNHSCSHLPINQETITKFKGYCTSYTLCSILDVSQNEALTSTSKCCISYSVAECIVISRSSRIMR